MLRKIYFGDISVIIFSCIYYTNYIENRELHNSSIQVLILKLVAIVLFIFGYYSRKSHIPLINVLVFIFFLLTTLSYFISMSFGYNNCDVLYLNIPLQMPLLLVILKQGIVKRIFNILLFVIILQIGLDFWLLSTKRLLSESLAFEGGFGNENLNGLFINISLIYLLFGDLCLRSVIKWFFVIILISGSFLTLSLFSNIASVIILLLYFNRITFAKKVWLSTLVVVLGFLIIGLSSEVEWGEYIKIGFIENKIMALGGVLGLNDYDYGNSGSISIRLSLFDRTDDGFENLSHIIWGHIYDCNYYRVDNQFLTILGSFGLPLLLCYCIFLMVWVLRALKSNNDFFKMLSFIFLLTLFTNRILDYFPAMLLLVLILNVRRMNLKIPRLASI